MPTQKSAWKWRCNLSWPFAQKITKGIHSCKPASQNRPNSLLPSDLESVQHDKNESNLILY